MEEENVRMKKDILDLNLELEKAKSVVHGKQDLHSLQQQLSTKIDELYVLNDRLADMLQSWGTRTWNEQTTLNKSVYVYVAGNSDSVPWLFVECTNGLNSHTVPIVSVISNVVTTNIEHKYYCFLILFIWHLNLLLLLVLLLVCYFSFFASIDMITIFP